MELISAQMSPTTQQIPLRGDNRGRLSQRLGPVLLGPQLTDEVIGLAQVVVPHRDLQRLFG